MDSKREVWVDWLRVTACFLVMVVHSTEPFYLGGEGSLVLTRADAFWAAFFDSLARSSVPLFVIASSYLQFPIHYSTGEFFRRRAVRILVPFAFWSLIYALVLGNPIFNLKNLVFNFNYTAGHLWFVYMIIGLYILMPLLSPWAANVGKKELQAYIGIWLFTTLLPYIREIMGGAAQGITFGPTGIPMPAYWPLWGEASWNSFGLFYYVSGFVGYLLLGLYFRRFVGDLSWKKTLLYAVPCLLIGFCIEAGGFFAAILRDAAYGFPVEGTVDLAVHWETTLTFCSLGVVLMAIGFILLMRKAGSCGRFYEKVVLPVSKASYGMYLLHMLILSEFSLLWRNLLGIGLAGTLGIWTTPVEIILTACCSYVCVAAVAVLIRKIPKVGVYLT